MSVVLEQRAGANAPAHYMSMPGVANLPSELFTPQKVVVPDAKGIDKKGLSVAPIYYESSSPWREVSDGVARVILGFYEGLVAVGLQAPLSRKIASVAMGLRGLYDTVYLDNGALFRPVRTGVPSGRLTSLTVTPTSPRELADASLDPTTLFGMHNPARPRSNIEDPFEAAIAYFALKGVIAEGPEVVAHGIVQVVPYISRVDDVAVQMTLRHQSVRV